MRNKGYTLIELMVTVAILGIVVALVGGLLFRGCAGATGMDATEAKQGAEKWAADMGFKDPKVSCVTQDSDGDGYVSCTIRDADGKLTAVECAKAFTMNEGCRMPKMGVAQP